MSDENPVTADATDDLQAPTEGSVDVAERQIEARVQPLKERRR